MRLLQNELSGYDENRYCKGCKEKYGAVTVSELGTMQDPDHPSAVTNETKALDYAFFQMVSRAEYSFFSGHDCQASISARNDTMDSAERNFFFSVYNAKTFIIPALEAHAAETLSTVSDVTNRNTNVRGPLSLTLYRHN